MTDDFEFEIKPEGEEIVSQAEIKIVEPIEHLWVVEPFGEGGDVKMFLASRPGPIRRFWMWVFFGWKFEPIQELGTIFEKEGD